MPKALIVIVTYNGAEYIGDCLSSLALVTYPEDRFRIIIIDNHSYDNTLEVIRQRFAEVIILKNDKNLGFAAANNQGMAYALEHGFDYVYLLNQDTVVDPAFLREAIQLAETDEQLGAVQSKLLLYYDQGKINSIGNEIHYLGFAFAGGHKTSDAVTEPREITYASGAAVLLCSQALKKIGFFNEDFFMYHEDTDLGWRLWLSGFKVMLSPQSVVYHKYEFSRSIKKYYYMERNRYLTIFQNYKFGTIVLILPALALMGVGMFFYSFFAGWWKENLRVFGYFLKPSTWIKIQKTRWQVQHRRVRSDSEAARMFVGQIGFQDLSNPILIHIVNPVFNAYWQIVKRIIW